MVFPLILCHQTTVKFLPNYKGLTAIHTTFRSCRVGPRVENPTTFITIDQNGHVFPARRFVLIGLWHSVISVLKYTFFYKNIFHKSAEAEIN